MLFLAGGGTGNAPTHRLMWPQASPGPMRDDASLAVVEAMLVAVVLFGALLFVVNAPLPGGDGALDRSGTDALASDLLRVLAGLPGGSGHASRLDEIVSEAVIGNRSGARDLARMLPKGAGYGLYLDNGVSPRTLYQSGSPTGEVASRDLVFYPDWDFDLVFATTENHSASSATDTLTLRAVHISNSFNQTVPWPLAVVYESGAHTVFANEATGKYVAAAVPPDAWVAGGYASTSERSYFVSVNGTKFRDVYRVNAGHPALDATLKAWADAGGHATATPKAWPGDRVALTYDLSGVGTATSRVVTVYGPAPGLVVSREAISTASGTWTYVVPRDALYGTYVIDTRVTFPSGTLQQTVHDITTFDVLRPGTNAPSPPVYRVVLAIWFNGL